MKKVLTILTSLMLLLVLSPFKANAEEGKIGMDPSEMKEVLFEHLGDKYGWEVPFSHSERIPLPIIIRDYNGDWHIFSSSRVTGGETYEGFQIAKGGDHNGKVVGFKPAPDGKLMEYRPLDLSITKDVFALFITAFVVILCVMSIYRWYKKNPLKAPRKGTAFMETLVEFIYSAMIKPILGENAKRFAPYLLTVFFFIFIMNLMGLMVVFPGGANLTGNISITFVLAICTFFVTNVFGTKAYWKEIFWPEVPLWLKFPIPIMPMIEIFGMFTKPAALMVRLFANMMGGHMIVLVLTLLIFIMGGLFGAFVAGSVTVISVAFSLFMLLIDTLVSFIQAYVFTMLSTIFISLAQAKHEEAEA